LEFGISRRLEQYLSWQITPAGPDGISHRETVLQVNYYSLARMNPTGIIHKGTPVGLGSRMIGRRWQRLTGG
jgi:hypothetical protein